MPSATTVTAIAAVITIPLIFTLVGGGRDAGLIIGVVLVAVGLAWSVLGSRRPSDGDQDEDLAQGDGGHRG
jgi:hypothetical protein